MPSRKLHLKLELDLPEELLEALGSESKISQRVREAFVIDLLHQGKLDQSRAAEVLGISRAELFDLMADHQVPVTDATREELKRSLADPEKALNSIGSGHPILGRDEEL